MGTSRLRHSQFSLFLITHIDISSQRMVELSPQSTLLMRQRNVKGQLERSVSELSINNEKSALLNGKEKDQSGFFSLSSLFPWWSLEHSSTLVFLTVTAFIVRLLRLGNPSVVVFDEVHFGGFASKYLRGEYFFDVHPPLARLLVALSGFLAGFEGDFNFGEIGADYVKGGVPYVAMRAFPAVFGALTVPIAYLTLGCLGASKQASLAGALLLLFENSFITQSRLILLDSYLVFFTALTGLLWTAFKSHSHRPFSAAWWISLVGCGVSLGAAASCKWVGLFTVALVGLYTIASIWRMIGDTSVPLKDIGKQLGAKAFALIVVPLTVYMATFWIHFAILTEYSSAASSMSLGFQSSLNGNKLPETNSEVYYGGTVSLRQLRPGGGYLHSHAHLWPEGSKQQQITIYHHRDGNNDFILRRSYVANYTYKEGDEDGNEENDFPMTGLRHGDIIRLEHRETGRFLHSHNVKPVLSDKEHHYEVSGYGNHANRFGDSNDNWIVEIVNDNGSPKTEYDSMDNPPPIRAVETKFRLVHANLGCRLHSSNKKLPKFGFGQGEVTCGKDTLLVNSIFMIETNNHSNIEQSLTNRKVKVRPASFWSKFVELNVEMWTKNAGLVASHPFMSRPEDWPLLQRGLGFWNGALIPKGHRFKTLMDDKRAKMGGEDKTKMEEEVQADALVQQEQAELKETFQQFKGKQIYLLGNAWTWWLTSASIAAFLVLAVVNRLVKQRFPDTLGSIALFQSDLFSLATPSGFLLSAWALHYFPFFMMQRQLFLHHYLPAYYFALLFMTLLVDRLTSIMISDKVKCEQVKRMLFGGLVIVAVVVFMVYAPLAYGAALTPARCSLMKIIPTWDFDCNSLV